MLNSQIKIKIWVIFISFSVKKPDSTIESSINHQVFFASQRSAVKSPIILVQNYGTFLLSNNIIRKIFPACKRPLSRSNLFIM